jgi:hypothetical protein
VTQLLVDTGFLVALYIRGDTLHQPAVDYLKRNRQPLRTVAAVIVETCFFLDSASSAHAPRRLRQVDGMHPYFRHHPGQFGGRRGFAAPTPIIGQARSPVGAASSRDHHDAVTPVSAR